MNVLMLHGINHNMFGKRDPKQYGTVTLAEIDQRLQELGKELGCEIDQLPDQRRRQDARSACTRPIPTRSTAC